MMGADTTETINRVADFATQLRRFNAERERLLQGRPISGDRRIPGPYSGVGGDVEEPQR